MARQAFKESREMSPKARIVIGVVALCGAVLPVVAQTPLTTERVSAGFIRPLFVTSPKNDYQRLFVVEQRGSAGVTTRADIRILNLNNNTINTAPFLTINGVTTGSEQGLLGLAFHPNYAQNGYFYVDYTTNGGGAAGQTVVARYKVSSGDPNVADPNSATILLTIAQPQSNHNGGWIAFGPDGFLYIATGDGGGAGDTGTGHNATFGNGQDTTQLLGKMLRIDVDNPAPPLNYSIPATNPFFSSVTARKEIWAYGLRNPWRNAFDRATGQLYIADVGQDAWEEVDVQPASSTGGENYGWRCYEGNNTYNTANCPPSTSLVFPVHTYSHSFGCSISGGYVYRGCAIPDLQGTYFFADYCSASIWSFRYTGSPNPTVTNRTAELAPGGGLSITSIVSFGEDARGEMYIIDQSGGEVFRIKPNGVAPACGLCYVDCNGDGVVGLADFGCFQTRFALQHPYADCNGDGQINLADFGCFQTKFALGCP
jgi:glucose/arabinose dehydrogenase